VAKRIDEASLSVGSPRRFVIPDRVTTTVCAGIDGAGDKGIGILAENFDPR
jgi:hypothetical protein